MSELRKKLNLKEELLVVVALPEELQNEFGQEQGWIGNSKETSEVLQAVLVFAENQVQLDQRITQVMPKVTPQTIVWFAYPKKTSKKYKSDLDRDHGWGGLIPYDYEPVCQVALSDDWSALRFKPFNQIPSRKTRMLQADS